MTNVQARCHWIPVRPQGDKARVRCPRNEKGAGKCGLVTKGNTEKRRVSRGECRVFLGYRRNYEEKWKIARRME